MKLSYLVTPNCTLSAQPNVLSATPNGIKNDIGPRTRLPNSTATAGAVIISLYNDIDVSMQLTIFKLFNVLWRQNSHIS